MPRRAVNQRVIALGVGIPLAIVVLVLLMSLQSGDGSDEAETTTTPERAAEPAEPVVDDEWNEDLAAALGPLSPVLVELASTVDAWSVGDVDDDGLRAVLDRAGPVVEDVRRAAGDLAEHAEDPLARPLIVDMAELYVRSVEAHRLALRTNDDIRTQYDHLGRRLRILADRVFDRARERTSAPVDPGPDVSLVLPAEVPDWERLEIAAGPPLVASDPNRVDDVPLSREDHRASQDEDGWRSEVAALDAPTSEDVRATLDDLEALDAMARRLVAASEALRAVPVPDGDRGRADRVALGWLLRADGGRAAQLASLDQLPETDPAGGLAGALLSISSGEVYRP